jgi:hypothetical protein
VENSTDDQGFPKRQDDFGSQNPFVSPLAVEERGQGYITRPGELLNPWISMWTRPRETVRQQLETDPAKFVLLLAILGGISGAYDEAKFASDDMAYRIGEFAGLTIFGGIVGVFYLFFMGWLAAVVGRGLGGVAYAAQVRTALAWSYIPSVWLLPLTAGIALSIAVLGPEVVYGAFVGEAREDFDFAALPLWLMAIGAVGLITLVWQIVITCKAVGEAHQFSAWRGLGTLLLAGVVVVGAVMALVLPVIALFALMA